MKRGPRSLLSLFSLFSLLVACPRSPTPPTSPPMEDPKAHLDRPLREQIAALEGGRITSAGLTEAYLARIEARDRGPAGIHAVLSLAPDAVSRAKAIDARRGKGAKLQGAVVLVKDNIDTQGLATTAGSLALVGNVPTKDAFAVAKLREANAVVLGKTNLSEWANFRGKKSTSGWSALGGLTANGKDPAYNACGSSSGSAAAIAAGLASAALGTETDGSVVCPASVNGVVGFKPTVGLVSRAGVIPISHTQDTIGLLTRSVGDAARLLSVLAGPDPADAATLAIPSGTSLDFEASLAAASLKGKRLGVVAFPFEPAVQALFANERARLVAAGAILVDVKLDLAFSESELTVLLYEFKVDVNGYLASHAREGQPGSLEALIEFNAAHAATELQHFGQELFVAAEETAGLDAPEYVTAKAKAKDGAGKNGIDALLAANALDALVSPTNSPAWKSDLAAGDPEAGVSSSTPAAVAGAPHLTVPMGRIDGLPVGISFFAGAWSDAEVLALGYAYEQLPR